MTMVSPKLTILDVGHGQSVVLQDSQGVLVFDAGKGPGLSMFLDQNGIDVIDAVVISHADADHVAGLTSLLLKQEVVVRKIYVNADSIKGSESWRGLRQAVSDAMQRGLRVTVGITTDTEAAEFKRGGLIVEILAPDPVLAMAGPGAKDLLGRSLSSNSMSVVIRISNISTAHAVLAGDLDGTGLQNLLKRQKAFPANLLVFPHHGGLPGEMDAEQFAEMICNAVQPRVVVFSIGRGSYGTPRPEIIAGIRKAVGNIPIACTQLSNNCAKAVPTSAATHINSSFASGRQRRACCAGSIQITMCDDTTEFSPNLDLHRAFVLQHAKSALCI